MVKFIDKISDEVLACINIAGAFAISGSCLAGYATAVNYGVVYEQEFAWLPAWTASPICMLISGITSMVLGSVMIYFFVKDLKKEEF